MGGAKGHIGASLFVMAALAIASPASAEPKARYDIPAQRLDRALMALAAKSGRQITFSPQSVRDKQTRALSGEYDVIGALAVLLKDNDLRAETVGGVILVLPAPRSVTAAPEIPPVSAPPPEASTASPNQDLTINPVDRPLSQVLVTSLKRETLIQTTPVTISLQQGGLAERGDIDISDYYRRVPGLQMTTNFANQERLAIRGVRGVGEATTGLYYDETPVTGPAGSAADPGGAQPDLNLFDTKRVEILRGPQGTLYGAGSMGGAVRVIFNKPDLDQDSGRIETRARLTEDGAPGGSIRGMANLVLSPDRLAVRLVGFDEQNGGYIDNVRFGRQDVNGTQSYGGRLAATLRVDDDLSLSATAILQHDHANDSDNYWYPRLGRYNSDAAILGGYRSDFDLYSATAHWALPAVTITAIASHYDWKTLEISDYTSTLQRAATDPSACAGYFGLSGSCAPLQAAAYGAYVNSRLPGAWYQPDTLHASSEEVRVSSPRGSRFTWIAGVFDEDRSDHFDSIVYRADPSTGVVQTAASDPTGFRYIETRVRQLAGFGEFEAKPIDRWTFSFGARAYSYDKSTGGQVVVPNLITGSVAGPFSSVTAIEAGWVSKLAAAYQLTPSAMLYANRQEGFRPGGANNVPGSGSAVPATYAPDSLVSYEMGVKTGWLQDRVNINANVYLIDWDNMQVRASSYSGAWQFNVNAGAARISGSEIDATALLTSNLYFSANAAVLDAHLISDQRAALGYATGVKGDRLPYTPHWTSAWSFMYRWPVFGGRYLAMTRFDYSFTGETASDFHPGLITYQVQPAYQVIDLQLGIQKAGVQMSVRVNNLLNVIEPSMVETSLSGVSGQTFSSRPRTVTFAIRKGF